MDIRNSHISPFASQVSSSVKRSFIATNFSSELPGYEQLTKSHIQKSIDGSRRTNLTDNLPFVVVFQTIEIQRLQKELDQARSGAMYSSHIGLDSKYLTDRITSIEREKERFSEENEKLNLICHQLYGELEDMKRKLSEVDFTATDKYHVERSRNTELQMELDTWRARYAASEKSRSKEIEDLRLTMDSQRKSMIDRDMRELSVRHQTQRSNLENQIRKLRDCLQAKTKELDETRIRFGQYEVNMMEMNRAENKLEDYENKLALISQEMMRLNELVKTKQEEIDMYKLREHNLSQKMKDQERWELELKQMKSSIDMRSREAEEWRVKYMRLEETQNRTRELESLNGNLQNRLRDFERELDRANSTVRDKLDEIEEWKRKFALQEHETSRYKNLQRELESYEDKIAVLTAEIQRLNHVLKVRLADIDEWRSKHNTLEATLSSYTSYERQNRELNDRLGQQSRLVQDIKSRLERTQGELQLMRNYERKTHEQEGFINNLNTEMERLNIIVKSKHQELDDYKLKYTRMESALQEYRHTESQNRDYENKINMLTQELERVNNVVRGKNQDLERATLTIRNIEEEMLYLRGYETKIAESEKTIITLNQTVDNIKREGTKWEDKIRTTESRCRELEQNCYAISQQKEKISNAMRTKTFELEEIRSKYNKMENESFRMKEIESSYYDLESKLALMSTQYERIDRLCRELEGVYEKEKTLSMQLAFKVIILSAEVERCQNPNTGIKSKDYAEMQERMYLMQSGLKEKDSQTVLLLEKVNSLQPKLAYLMGELDRYLAAITINEKKTRQLEQEVSQYQDYTKRIGVLSAEIDRLSADNKVLDEDTRKIRMRYADTLHQELSQQKMLMLVVIMAAEIENLRLRVTEKESQFQEMRRSILSPIRNFEGDYRRF